MRDGNRLKEKIELRLDQRQVVSFAMIALLLTGAVFALGVMVGKNLATMPGVQPQKPENLLDRLDANAKAGGLLGDGGNDGLTFQEELTKPRQPLSPMPEKKKPVVTQKTKSADVGPALVTSAPVNVPVPAPAVHAVKPTAGTTGGAPETAAADAPYFTVQVKATQSQPDADHFVTRLQGEGFQPFVADVDLPGKGHWYRVRVGHFDSRAKAERYLADFKRETHLEAFVTAAGH